MSEFGFPLEALEDVKAPDAITSHEDLNDTTNNTETALVNELTSYLVESLSELYRGEEIPNLEEKLSILSKLPNNLIQDLDGYLRSEEINEETYARHNNRRPGRFNEKAHLRGEIFERLVSSEFESQPDKLGTEVLSLLRNPDRYNYLQELGYVRNPDLAVVDIDDDNRLVIKQAGDAKLGSLNYRSYRQFKDTGFKSGFNKLAEVVNNSAGADLEANGLGELGAARDLGLELTVAEDYRQRIIVPSDRTIDNDNVEYLIDRGSFYYQRGDTYKFNEAGFNDFKQLLSSEHVSIEQSSFSTKEVGHLSNKIFDLIQERREAQADSSVTTIVPGE